MPKDNTTAPNAAPVFQEPTGELNVNLMQQYPLYDGGDARVEKIGHKGPPIHGRLLAVTSLPSTIANDDGEITDWKVYVIELLQPTFAQPPGKDDSGNAHASRWYQKGDRIGLTMSTAIAKFEMYAADPKIVFEVCIKPVVGKTKKGRSLWNYEDFRLLNKTARTAKDSISATNLLSPEGLAAARAAMSEGNGMNGLAAGGQANGQTVQSAPFA
jgi:hypothetical protein